MSSVTEPPGLREENRTLYGVIKLVSSSIELGPMLQGVVDLATQATDCHACFIYLLADDQLTSRASSHARVHPRGRDGRSANEIRATAAGGAVSVDGRGPDPVALQRHARCD